MIGLETALAAVFTRLVEPGRVPLATVIGALSWRPAKIAGLTDHGGPVAAGRPANLCVFDPDDRWIVDAAAMASRSRNSPFDGWKLDGRVRHTVLGGEPVVVDGGATR